METTTALETRPSDPREISFAPHCFVQVGTRTMYSVARSALHSGPAVFDNAAAAEEFASRCGRAVTAYEVAIKRRVSWR
jgi:hypothetical protein